jgi:hypothetical protein
LARLLGALLYGIIRRQFVARDLLGEKSVPRFVGIESADDVVPVAPLALAENDLLGVLIVARDIDVSN